MFLMHSFHAMPPRRDGVYFSVHERVARGVMLRKQPQKIENTENQTYPVLSH